MGDMKDWQFLSCASQELAGLKECPGDMEATHLSTGLVHVGYGCRTSKRKSNKGICLWAVNHLQHSKGLML